MQLTNLLGPDVIFDIPKLKNVDIVALGEILSKDEVRDRLVHRINETAKVQLLKGEILGHDPAFTNDPAFASKKWYNRWYSALSKRVCGEGAKGSLITVLLPAAVYLHDCYGLSCSKLILGCEVPTTPPRWVRSWLLQAERLPADKLTKLYDILSAGKNVQSDVVYTLKSRLEEMAAERGMGLTNFIIFPGIRLREVTPMLSFADATFTETGNSYEYMKPFFGNHMMLRFLVSICVLYGVSPDYLLLQDYSEFAVDDTGRYYAPAYRTLLSKLLRADANTRNKAIAFVFASTAIDAALGSSVPTLEDNGTAAERKHIMGAFAEATTTMTKKESERQIIEDLKPQICALLQASDEPLSSTKVYQIAPGHFRLIRKALKEMEESGEISSFVGIENRPFWRMAKSATKKRKDRDT